jgi:hypothetical protein
VLQYLRDFCFVKTGAVVNEFGSKLSSPFIETLDVSWEDFICGDDENVEVIMDDCKDHLKKFYIEGFVVEK